MRLAISFFCLLLAFGCQDQSNQQAPAAAIPVKYQVIKTQKINSLLEYSGEVRAENQRALSFPVPGRIGKVYVEEGDQVKKGQLLMQLEQNEYQQGLLVAEKKMAQAQSEYDRLKKMYDRQSLTKSDFLKIETALAEAKANLVVFQRKLSYTQIRANEQGRVDRLFVRSGETVKEGVPVISMLHSGQYSIQFSLPENQIAKVKVGDSLRFRVPSISKSYFNATVDHIRPSADVLTRSFAVFANIEKAPKNLMQGMVAEVNIQVNGSQPQLVIPTNYVVPDPDGNLFVFIVQGNRAVRKRVIGDQLVGKGMLIEQGLSQGDSLIVAGQWKLTDGRQVKVVGHGTY